MPRTVLSSSMASVLWVLEANEKGLQQDVRHVMPRGLVIQENLTRLAAIETRSLGLQTESHRDSDCGYANNNAYDESGITKTRWLT